MSRHTGMETAGTPRARTKLWPTLTSEEAALLRELETRVRRTTGFESMVAELEKAQLLGEGDRARRLHSRIMQDLGGPSRRPRRKIENPDGTVEHRHNVSDGFEAHDVFFLERWAWYLDRCAQDPLVRSSELPRWRQPFWDGELGAARERLGVFVRQQSVDFIRRAMAADQPILDCIGWLKDNDLPAPPPGGMVIAVESAIDVYTSLVAESARAHAQYVTDRAREKIAEHRPNERGNRGEQPRRIAQILNQAGVAHPDGVVWTEARVIELAPDRFNFAPPHAAYRDGWSHAQNGRAKTTNDAGERMMSMPLLVRRADDFPAPPRRTPSDYQSRVLQILQTAARPMSRNEIGRCAKGSKGVRGLDRARVLAAIRELLAAGDIVEIDRGVCLKM